MAKYSIYLSTCDTYSDCWDPFFTLFEKFWPTYDGKIYLSSEYKDYQRSNVTALKMCESHSCPKTRRVTWSKLIRWCLEAIPEDIILFMQEDFFLKGPVRYEYIESYCDLMLSDPDIKCIQLTDLNGPGSTASNYEGLDLMLTHRQYRIACQCALWRKEELLTLLRDRESPWEWEHYGSSRSAVLGHTYLQVNRDFVKQDIFEIVPYIYTGIIEGRWNPPVVPLFERNGINMDFSIRGFYSRDNHSGTYNPSIKERLINRIKKARHKIDLFFIEQSVKTRGI